MATVTTNVKNIPTDAEKFALFSGGNDSVASTHYAYENHEIDMVVYLDTNSGIDENIEHVKSVCESYGWPLAIISSPVTLKQFALGTDTRQPLGFPGPAIHSWAFQYFKQRQLRMIARHVEAEPEFYTGVRSDESSRRMQTVSDEVQEGEQWLWIAPIHDWSDSDVDQYRDEHSLPSNPVAEKIGRSGDCYCGAFANRDTELTELQAHYPDHYDWLTELEDEVQDEIGKTDAHCYWGFGNMSEKELRAEMAQNDDQQMMLCSSCDVPDHSDLLNDD